MFGFDPMYMIIMAVSMGASQLVGMMLKRRFNEYSQIPTQSGMSGAEIAEKMLRDSGITDVKVQSVGGMLTDHYNPRTKTVNLSEGVYNQRNVAAAAVSAHECGHAIQHATAYSFLTMRSKLVPVVNFSSRFTKWVIMAGFAVMAFSGNTLVLLGGIILFGLTTLFAFVTLPVEFDASNRALIWLNQAQITSGVEHEKAKSALKWAAGTYVVAALASLAQLLYFLRIFMNARNR